MPSFTRLHARCGCASATGPFVLAGTGRKYERGRPFVVEHMDLALGVDVAGKQVRGTAVLHFTRKSETATELVLDAVGFDVGRVRLDAGKGLSDADFTYDGEALTIRVPKSAKVGKVSVTYSAKPRRGLYFLAPDAAVPDRPTQVWSQCQDEDARHFIPCQDKPHVKMTTRVTLRVPRGFTALSNGELESKSTPRGSKDWSYRFSMKDPIPSYLITVVVGMFDVVEDRPALREGRPSVPVSYYVPKGKREEALRSLGETPRMIELFGRVTGVPFPWTRYTQVVVKDFVFGGMENTTATTLYEHVLYDSRAAVDVTSNDLVAHELAHHWFGDFVTCRDWSHAWLNEGFATYLEHIEREDRLGLHEYEYGVDGDVAAYLGEASGRYQRPIVCRDYEEPLDLFDRHLYEKGGLVLHMLRRDLGDAIFWKGVHRYLHEHGGGIVETNDLQRAFEGASGKSFEQFFDQWVYRPGHPVLKVTVSWDSGHLRASVKQTQKTAEVPLFAFPLEIEIGTKSGKTLRKSKWIDSESDSLTVPLAERPEWVVVDPRFSVVGSVTVESPADMQRAQLARGTTARHRWLAARALAKRTDPATIRALGKCLEAEPERWMVRSEAAMALGKITGADAFDWLAKAAKTRHPKVRRAVHAALGQFRTEAAAKLLASAAQKDESYLASAEAARALGATRRDSALATLVSVLGKASWADVVRVGALDGLAALRNPEAVSEVRGQTRYGRPTPARRAAVLALAELSEDRPSREHLEDLLEDPDPHFRMSVVRALEILAHPRSRGPLRKQLERDQDGRVARRIKEALRTMSHGPSADHRRLSDEVEQLRKELTDLKTRLSGVEAVKGGKKGAARKNVRR